MIAQDTGGAIRGAVRADIFFGFGPQAEDRAGHNECPRSTISCSCDEIVCQDRGRTRVSAMIRRDGDLRIQRATSEQERREFEEDFRLARPIKPKLPARAGKKVVAAGGGLDGGTQNRLNRGLLEPQARLDLHGMTAERSPSRP